MLDAYFAAQFEGGRHQHRIEKMAVPSGVAAENSRSGDACGSETKARSTDAIRTGALDSGCDRGKDHADRTDAMREQRMRQVRIDGYDDPQMQQTFRQKQGKPDAACAHGQPGNAPASAGITSAQDRATPTTKR